MDKYGCLVLLLLILHTPVILANDLSPLDFGLSQAKNDIERYEIILRTHKSAIERNKNISYKGIDTIRLEIPSDAESIPMTEKMDFNGTVFIVVNKHKDLFLFSLINKFQNIEITKQELETGDFRSIPELCKGYVLLNIVDDNLWVDNRRGYKYGVKRKDILFIKNGKALNTPIMSYDCDEAQPLFTFTSVSDKVKSVSNLTLIRDAESTFKTFCLNIENQNRIYLYNVNIHTPQSDLYGDTAINFRNCTNLTCRNISIDGTYSQLNKYGYGISMDNVWNSEFHGIKSTDNCRWGLFGNNNINKVTLTDCDINRFDIHCYGKDVLCEKSTFRNLYNQFSSMAGEVVFNNCRFIKFVPVLIESSYNAYTLFDVKFQNCSIEVDPARPYLIDLGSIDFAKRNRSELSKIQLPSLVINGMNILFDNKQERYLLYRLRTGHANIDQQLSIDINNLNSFEKTVRLLLSNCEINFSKGVLIKNRNSNITFSRDLNYSYAFRNLSDI